MVADNEFVAEFAAVLVEVGNKRLKTPGEVVRSWRGLVSLVAEGYGENLYEYNNDLSIRDVVERVLNNPRMSAYPQMTWVREEVEAVDRQFRALLLPDPVTADDRTPWWRARVPRYGGGEFVADIADRYGVNISRTD